MLWHFVVLCALFLGSHGFRSYRRTARYAASTRVPFEAASSVSETSFEELGIDEQSGRFEYSGEKIDRYYRKRPLKVWERCVDIGSPILGWWLAREFDKATNFMRTESEKQKLVNDRAEDLKDAIVQGKSIVFIKSGQALSLRQDLVKSPEYVRELAKLQDEVGTFPTPVAMEIIKNQLKCDDVNEIYDFDPPDPIASASIGQVFKAKVRETGQQVAVKVQRPDAMENTPLDMYILRSAARALRRRYKTRSNLEAIADEFGSQIYGELNYEQEASNCLKFKGLYGHIPGIFVPGVDLNLTRKRVLTQEWVEGEKGPWEEGGEEMLTVGLQCSVLQLLGTGYFHSDPHRGNLLRTPDGDLAYLDFGMMSDVPAERRYALIGTVLGLVNKDIQLVIDNLKKLDFLPDDTNTDEVVTALKEAFVKSTTGGSGRGSSLNFTALNKNINEMSYLLPISLPPFYTLIIRTLTILEGLALSVDPSFRLVKGAYPFIAKQVLVNQQNSSDAASQQEMNRLLSSIMVDQQTQRIRWSKLEQFVSISSYADKAVGGDFAALKKAQNRADLIKTYSRQDDEGASQPSGGAVRQIRSPVGGGSSGGDTSKARENSDDVEDEGEEGGVRFSQELVLNILDFLLSPNGRFIREPLVNEAADTVDALGLTAVSVLSLLSNGLVPKPRESPDQERVVQAINLMGSLAESRVRESPPSGAGGPQEDSFFDRVVMGELSSSAEVSNAVTQNIRLLRDALATLRTWINLPPDDESRQQVDQILTRAAPLVRRVIGKLVSRNIKRATQQIITPSSVEAALPTLLNVVDTLSGLAGGGKTEGAEDNNKRANRK